MKKQKEKYINSIKEKYLIIKINKFLSYHYIRKHKWKLLNKRKKYSIKNIIIIQSLYRKYKAKKKLYWKKLFINLRKKRKINKITSAYHNNLQKYISLSYQSIIGQYSIDEENKMIEKDIDCTLEYYADLLEKEDCKLIKEYNKKSLPSEWIPQKDINSSIILLLDSIYYFNLNNGKIQYTNPNIKLYNQERDELNNHIFSFNIIKMLN